MKFLSTKCLSAALALTAFAAVGIAPAFAQSQATGSLMPYYYETTGAKTWGAWKPRGPSVVDRRVTQASPQLFLDAAPLAPRQPWASGFSAMRDRFGIESQR